MTAACSWKLENTCTWRTYSPIHIYGCAVQMNLCQLVAAIHLQSSWKSDTYLLLRHTHERARMLMCVCLRDPRSAVDQTSSHMRRTLNTPHLLCTQAALPCGSSSCFMQAEAVPVWCCVQRRCGASTSHADTPFGIFRFAFPGKGIALHAGRISWCATTCNCSRRCERHEDMLGVAIDTS